MNHIPLVHEDVYLVGSPNLTSADDCCVYLIDLGDLVMIDAGAGQSVSAILENIASLGFSPNSIAAVVLTHCHIDHIGGIPLLREKTGCEVIAHELDAQAIESGDPEKTAAALYGKKNSAHLSGL